MRHHPTTQPCDWCHKEFTAYRQAGRRRRFCTRRCFNAAKRWFGVIRRAA